MSKFIKKVDEVLRRARNNGDASDAPYSATYTDGELVLRHYGTVIFVNKNGDITRLGGWSSSDRDAISTAFRFSGRSGIDVTRSAAVAKKASANGMPVNEMDGWYVIGSYSHD